MAEAVKEKVHKHRNKQDKKKRKLKECQDIQESPDTEIGNVLGISEDAIETNDAETRLEFVHDPLAIENVNKTLHRSVAGCNIDVSGNESILFADLSKSSFEDSVGIVKAEEDVLHISEEVTLVNEGNDATDPVNEHEQIEALAVRMSRNEELNMLGNEFDCLGKGSHDKETPPIVGQAAMDRISIRALINERLKRGEALRSSELATNERMETLTYEILREEVKDCTKKLIEMTTIALEEQVCERGELPGKLSDFCDAALVVLKGSESSLPSAEHDETVEMERHSDLVDLVDRLISLAEEEAIAEMAVDFDVADAPPSLVANNVVDNVNSMAHVSEVNHVWSMYQRQEDSRLFSKSEDLVNVESNTDEMIKRHQIDVQADFSEKQIETLQNQKDSTIKNPLESICSSELRSCVSSEIIGLKKDNEAVNMRNESVPQQVPVLANIETGSLDELMHLTLRSVLVPLPETVHHIKSEGNISFESSDTLAAAALPVTAQFDVEICKPTAPLVEMPMAPNFCHAKSEYPDLLDRNATKVLMRKAEANIAIDKKLEEQIPDQTSQPTAPVLETSTQPLLMQRVQYENSSISNLGAYAEPVLVKEREHSSFTLALEDSSYYSAKQKIIHKKIAIACIPMLEGNLKPFTESQLKSLYYNPELEGNQIFIDDFVENHRTLLNHEFQEILLGYLRARNNLQAATKEIQVCQNEFRELKEHLWIMSEHTVSSKGHCEDGKLVTGSHIYHKAMFNDSVGNKVDRLLKRIRELIHDQFCMHAYSSQMGRLQVESYLHNLLLSSPDLKNIPHNAPIQGCHFSQLSPSISAQVENLKKCISILFAFQRKPIKDKQFVTDTRVWLARLVAILLRVATYEDHLFLLNHVLRCPAGVGDWAALFIQLPLLPVSCDQVSFGNQSLDHAVTVLATLLLPVKAREEFLQHVKSLMMSSLTTTSSKDIDDIWVLIDSEGEEDEDPSNYWLYWRENDLVALLNQVPLESIFRHILRIDQRDGSDIYDVNLTTEQSMLKVLAFATQLVHILRDGLKTFNLVRYRQLTKRISRLIRHTVQYVSDHWLNFRMMHATMDSALLIRLQVEFDQFFRRATRCIFSSQKLGAWQFMAGLPYVCVSTSMLWQIINMLHSSNVDDKDQDSTHYVDAHTEWQDQKEKIQFEESLVSMPECEAYYLLTTFANMACSRDSSAKNLIQTIALEIYEIAFVSNHTREMCSKGGRELLSMVASKHPFILSQLIHSVKETMTQVGMVSLYLFRELPFHQWKPLENDLNVIEDWLLSSQLTSPPNLLARLVVANMNWGFIDQELFLDISLHRKIALLVVEAYGKLVPGKGGLITESFKQVSNITNLVCQTPTPEQAFCQWAWDLLLHLRLHLFSLPVGQICNAFDNATSAFQAIPNMERDAHLRSLQNGIRDKQPTACYVALAMTTYGHSITEFGNNLNLLCALLEGHHYTAAIHILSLVSAIFYTSNNSLKSCERYKEFAAIAQSLLMCDITYVKMAKNLVLPEFPGRYLRMFVAMILKSADDAASLGSSASAVYIMWLEVMCSLHQWSRDRNALYVIDSICKAAFVDQRVVIIVKEFFLEYYRTNLSSSRFSNPVSSFLNWVSTGSASATIMLSRQSCVEFPWFTWFALDVEAQIEEESQLWKGLAFEMLANSRITPDAALKKVGNKLHMLTPPIHHLAIYHWAQQALDNLLDHSLTHLFWQRFFGLYLQRWPVELNEPDKGSVGARFFDSMSNLHLLKRMKKRLHELNDYHQKQAKEYAKYKRSENEFCENEETAKELVILSRAKYHGNLAKLYGTLILWVEESKLHDGSLYLPALPPQYDASRLLLLQQNDKAPWLEFIDFDQMQKEHAHLISEWMVVLTHKQPQAANSAVREDSACESIVKRLASYETPKPPPPIIPLKAPVPEVSENIFHDEKATVNLLHEHFNILVDYARTFAHHVNQHLALDCDYLEYIPELYKNVDNEVSDFIACKQGSGGLLRSSDTRCSGPACIILKFKSQKLIEAIQTLIVQNRTDWQELINEILLPPSQNVCSAAVFIENLLVLLIKKYQFYNGQQDIPAINTYKDIGVSLFYHFHKLISAETTLYSPTRQFLTSSIEILGQEFISGNGEQCETLVKVILKSPQSVGLLAPHFTPTAASRITFIQLYTQMVAVSALHSTDLAFVLLTKFDINTWLTIFRPRLSERQQILHTIGDVIQSMGLHPDESLHPTCELYRNHMQTLLLYQFPDHYSDVLQLLFKGSDFQNICVELWYDLLNSLLMETKVFPLKPYHMEGLRVVCQKFAQNQIMFTTQQLRETLNLFCNHFSQRRQCTKDVAIYGLYCKYKPYIMCIANYLAVISHAFIASARQDYKKHGFEQVSEIEIWPEICKAFSPWIQPLLVNGKFLMPWIPADVHLASIMISSFTESIKYLQLLTNYSPNLVALFFEYYSAVCNAHDGSPYILVDCYNKIFQHLEWKHFHLNSKAMQLIMRLLNCGSAECIEFLGSIVIHLQWPTIVTTWVQYETPLTLIQNIADIAYLFVKLSFEPSLKQEDSFRSLLHIVESFPWHLIDAHTYEILTKCFLTNCNVECIFGTTKTVQDTAVLQFLKVCAGLVSWVTEFHHEAQKKQSIFLHMFIQILCTWTNKNRESLKTFNDRIIRALVELLQDIENVSMRLKAGSLFEESIPLLTEIFNLLNCASEAALQDICIHAILSWAAAHPCSIIIPPCLRTACSSLVNIKHTVIISEAVIYSYFGADPKECACLAVDCGWSNIIGAIQIPDLPKSEFFSECLKHGAFLTLYSMVVHYQLKCALYEDTLNLFNQVVQWSSKTETSIETTESKLLLFWSKAVELAILLSSYQQDMNIVCRSLLTFCEALLQFGEDKASIGFFGALGFGKKSQFSNRFRLCARATAAFILSQVTPLGTLRLEGEEEEIGLASAKGSLNKDFMPQQMTAIAISQLEICKGHKLYVCLQEQVEYLLQFIKNQQNNIQNFKTFFSYLSIKVFPDKNYLFILRENEQIGLQLCSLFSKLNKVGTN